MRLTKGAWTWLLMGVPGSVIIGFLSWWLLQQGGPPMHLGRAIWTVEVLFVLLWILIGSMDLRRDGRWVITKRQEAEVKRARLARQHEAWKRDVQDVYASLDQLHQLREQHGLAGEVAFILNVPVEDILRVAGDQPRQSAGNEEGNEKEHE